MFFLHLNILDPIWINMNEKTIVNSPAFFLAWVSHEHHIGNVDRKMDESILVVNRMIGHVLWDCLNICGYQKLHFVIVRIPYDEDFTQNLISSIPSSYT